MSGYECIQVVVGSHIADHADGAQGRGQRRVDEAEIQVAALQEFLQDPKPGSFEADLSLALAAAAVQQHGHGFRAAGGEHGAMDGAEFLLGLLQD